MKPHLPRQIPASHLIERMNPDLQEKVRGRYMVTTLRMAIGLSLDDAIADHNAHRGEISRRDSLALDEVTGNTWERITACSDLDILTHWLNRAATVTTAERLFATRPGHA